MLTEDLINIVIIIIIFIIIVIYMHIVTHVLMNMHIKELRAIDTPIIIMLIIIINIIDFK
jgi:hypothetical protein